MGWVIRPAASRLYTMFRWWLALRWPAHSPVEGQMPAGAVPAAALTSIKIVYYIQSQLQPDRVRDLPVLARGSADMPELMNHVEFRTALENAIKGKSANKAPFSVAWASGKLNRDHLARWAENHFHYVGPFADYLAYVYARMPDRYTEAKDFLLANMYEEEIGGDRHTDLLIRFAEACGTTRERVIDPDNMSPTTRGLQSWCYAVAMREDPIVAVAA